MRIEKVRFHRLISAAVFFGLLCLLLFSASVQAEILIITNKNVPETSLSKDYVKEIFLGKRAQWQDNSTIHPAVLKDAEIHKKFLKEFIRKSNGKWKSYWKRMVFTGRGLPPKTINSEAELIEYVSGTDGAVGYVSSDELPEDAENITVNILKIGR